MGALGSIPGYWAHRNVITTLVFLSRTARYHQRIGALKQYVGTPHRQITNRIVATRSGAVKTLRAIPIFNSPSRHDRVWRRCRLDAQPPLAPTEGDLSCNQETSPSKWPD